MSQMIKVGISDLNIACQGETLVTYALGSCVGICLYDKYDKVAGLSHIMLPASNGFEHLKQPYKFADTAIPILVQKMEAAGAKRVFIKAKIAGGAQMFGGLNDTTMANIGERNVMAVKAALKKLKIDIIAEDTGKNYGRTQYFNAEDGVMTIKSANRGEWVY